MEEDGIQAQACKFPRIENRSARNDSSNNKKIGSNNINKENGGELRKRSGGGGGSDGSSNPFHSWHHQSSRIIRISRASGGKDRHSKVMTSKGLRDRRVRLSVTTAIQFYDLQDRLGYDRPSKAVEWLIKAASDAISELPSLNNTFPETPKQPSDEKRDGEKCIINSVDAEVDGEASFLHQQNQNRSQNLSLSKSACSSTSETSKGSGLSLSRSEIRVKARERARERAAKEKEKENDESCNNIAQQQNNNVISMAQTSSFTELLTGGINTSVQAATSPTGSGQQNHNNHRTDEVDLFNKGARHHQWSVAPMDYFSAGLLGGSLSSRTHHHYQSSAYSGQIQSGNNLAQAMSIAPFGVQSENHTEQLQHFSFIPDHLMPAVVTSSSSQAPSGGGGGSENNLNFTISSSNSGGVAAGFNSRGTLQSNSPSFLPHHLQQRFSPFDGSSNLPFFIGAAPAINSTDHTRSPVTDDRGTMENTQDHTNYKCNSPAPSLVDIVPICSRSQETHPRGEGIHTLKRHVSFSSPTDVGLQHPPPIGAQRPHWHTDRKPGSDTTCNSLPPFLANFVPVCSCSQEQGFVSLDAALATQKTRPQGEGIHTLIRHASFSFPTDVGLHNKYVQSSEDSHAILHSLNTLSPLSMKKSGLGLTEPPKDEAWHSVVFMELANNKLSELPLSPSSPELRVLMLQGNADLARVPSTFFFKMPLLTVLDLSHTSLRELPDSIFELEQLREMYLKGCERFMKLSPKIGKLKSLEKLNLDGTQIIHLPEEIQELTNLQSLFLCFYEYCGRKGKQYTRSTIIPSKVISKLKGLKHLSIDVNPDDERWYENVLDIIPEILALEHLQTLSLYIPHLELLKFIPDRILRDDFRLIVGRHMRRIISSTPSTIEAKFKQCGSSLKFVNGEDFPDEIKRLVRHSKALFLERHKTIKHLSGFKMMNLEQLRVCMLAECREMQTIVDRRQSNRGNDIFSHLLYLYVSHMKSLRSIWEGVKPHRSFFGLLKSLVLQNCPELTTVFTMDFLGNLSLLKELIVKDCPKVTTLISDGSSIGEIFLPKLRKIMLLHLPELVTISNGCYIAPSLNGMAVYDCPKLQSLSNSELLSQTLKVIKGEIKWWDQLQWSKEEWGTSQRPSKFDRIFSSIDNQVDIMTQIGNDGDDIDDDADMMPSETLFVPLKQNADAFGSCKMSSDTCSQASCVTNSITQRGSAMDNQVDIMSQIGNDGDNIDDDADMAPPKTLFEHPKQNADSFRRRRNARRLAFLTKSEVDVLDDDMWRKQKGKSLMHSTVQGSHQL